MGQATINDLADLSIIDANPHVLAVGAVATAATLIDTPNGGHVIISCDNTVWYAIGASDVAAPVISSASGTSRARVLHPGQEKLVHLNPSTQTYIRCITDAAHYSDTTNSCTYIRWEQQA